MFKPRAKSVSRKKPRKLRGLKIAQSRQFKKPRKVSASKEKLQSRTHCLGDVAKWKGYQGDESDEKTLPTIPFPSPGTNKFLVYQRRAEHNASVSYPWSRSRSVPFEWRYKDWPAAPSKAYAGDRFPPELPSNTETKNQIKGFSRKGKGKATDYTKVETYIAEEVELQEVDFESNVSNIMREESLDVNPEEWEVGRNSKIKNLKFQQGMHNAQLQCSRKCSRTLIFNASDQEDWKRHKSTEATQHRTAGDTEAKAAFATALSVVASGSSSRSIASSSASTLSPSLISVLKTPTKKQHYIHQTLHFIYGSLFTLILKFTFDFKNQLNVKCASFRDAFNFARFGLPAEFARFFELPTLRDFQASDFARLRHCAFARSPKSAQIK
ncbi:hypothetical protein DFH09DRAFT_1105056 [Mycena vulgaris]|nr:hypothetical protein DFH09DRAFT_1105056 [Mycena vulgaris]